MNGGRWTRLCSGLLLVLLIVCTQAGAGRGAADGTLGVGINVGSIHVEDALLPGQRYALTTVVVTNTGTQAAQFTLDVLYHTEQMGARPPREWFVFEPARFPLDPGQNQHVLISLKLPLRADAGEYSALVAARPAISGQGTTLGVAAASKLDFRVRQAAFLPAVWLLLIRKLADAAPWSYAGVASVGMGLIWFFGLRRYRFELTVRHR